MGLMENPDDNMAENGKRSLELLTQIHFPNLIMLRTDKWITTGLLGEVTKNLPYSWSL